jgi:hypothetical protein
MKFYIWAFFEALSKNPSFIKIGQEERVLYMNTYLYRVIHKSLRDFRPLWYSNRDGHAEEGHVNRGGDTPSFCPNLQVLDMSNLGGAADVNPVIKFLPHTINHVA